MSQGYQLKTQGEYDFGEVLSALQKSIRRGFSKDAMFWAMEMLPNFRKALWLRLKVIVNEDIGIANPFATVYIETLHHQFDQLYSNKKFEECFLPLSNAILYMCMSQKTRIADYFQCVMKYEHQTHKYDVPDYALDKHTKAGKVKKRGWEHFQVEGCKLSREREEFDPDRKIEKEAFEIWKSGTLKRLGWE